MFLSIHYDSTKHLFHLSELVSGKGSRTERDTHTHTVSLLEKPLHLVQGQDEDRKQVPGQSSKLDHKKRQWWGLMLRH